MTRSSRHRSRVPESITHPSPWRRYAPRGLMVAAVAAALLCARSVRAPDHANDHSRYNDRSVRVAHVVDGDTLDIDATDGDKPVTRIRLWGVDTPETTQSGRSAKFFGPEARAFAERTLTGRDVHIVLSPKRTRGKYGRLLAYVFLERGGRMFNEILLEEGYAYADLRFEHHYHDRFKVIEKRARKAAVGLWENVAIDQMPEWKQRFERTDSGPEG